ncbi:MAG: hypothetical protein ACLU38_12985 [Dysosmobacter sp.]
MITLNENIRKLEAGIKKLEAGIEQLEGVIALEEALSGQGEHEFPDFLRRRYLGQSAATAKQMNDLWLVYASGKVEKAAIPPTRRDSLRRVAAQRSRGQS